MRTKPWLKFLTTEWAWGGRNDVTLEWYSRFVRGIMQDVSVSGVLDLLQDFRQGWILGLIH